MHVEQQEGTGYGFQSKRSQNVLKILKEKALFLNNVFFGVTNCLRLSLHWPGQWFFERK